MIWAEQDPSRRYTRRHPGELVQLDVKNLGRISGFYGHRLTRDRRRGAGGDFVDVAIPPRLAPGERRGVGQRVRDTSAALPARAVTWFRR
jgi:hypothetical protein